MIFDILFIAIVIIFIVTGWRWGLSRTLLSVLSTIGATLITALLCGYISSFIVDVFIRDALVDNINNAIVSSVSGETSAVLSVLPDAALRALSYFGIGAGGLESYCADAIAAQSTEAANAVADAVLPAIEGVVSTAVSIVLFVLLSFVFHLVAKAATRSIRRSSLRPFDSFLGGVLGFFQGVLIVFVSVMILNLLVPIFSAEGNSGLESYTQSSFIISFINKGEFVPFVRSFVYNVKDFANI